MSGGLQVEGVSIEQITSTKKLKLLQSKRAKDIFKTKANQLIAQNVLTEFDLEQLALYAVALDNCYSCMENMDELVVEEITKGGIKLVVSPHVKVFKEMAVLCNQIGASFGFTPVDRQKIKTEAPKQEDALTKFMNDNL